jgi:hypothetical protein
LLQIYTVDLYMLSSEAIVVIELRTMLLFSLVNTVVLIRNRKFYVLLVELIYSA